MFPKILLLDALVSQEYPVVFNVSSLDVQILWSHFSSKLVSIGTIFGLHDLTCALKASAVSSCQVSLSLPGTSLNRVWAYKSGLCGAF